MGIFVPINEQISGTGLAAEGSLLQQGGATLLWRNPAMFSNRSLIVARPASKGVPSSIYFLLETLKVSTSFMQDLFEIFMFGSDPPGAAWT